VNDLFKITFAFQLTLQLANAQCGPQPLIKNPQSPDPCKMDRISRSFPVAYSNLREADVMWSKRTWRVIDLHEKLNLPMYYPVEPQVCLMSLFDVLKCAILEGDLKAFSNPVFDDEFTDSLTKQEVRNLLVSWDSTAQTEDINNSGNMISAPRKTEIASSSITQYWIKEDWFFDKQRSVMEVRIIGICPLTQKFSESGEAIGTKPLFWIYFPEARKYLVRAAVFNRSNDHERMNYDELFEKRMFSSNVYKESNVYDRSIAEYKNGTDAVLESDEIKENIFKYESNLWHY
jgi:gliding motility associated protien GldN